MGYQRIVVQDAQQKKVRIKSAILEQNFWSVRSLENVDCQCSVSVVLSFVSMFILIVHVAYSHDLWAAETLPSKG